MSRSSFPLPAVRSQAVVVLDHPLVQHKLTLLRQASTSTADFRRLCREISLLMAYEATRDLELEPV